MIKNILLTLCVVVSMLSYAQETLKSSDILPFAHPLELSENTIKGKGAEILEHRISTSQFLLLGEEHYSPEISELTNTLLPMLKSVGFNHFALEVGPHSVEKMISLLEKDSSLYQFNTDFYSKYRDIPFPFFDGKKDELFLKNAMRENFKIWGIDQEFLSAQLFLIDEIYSLSAKKKLVQPYFESAKKYLKEEFAKSLENEKYPMFSNLLKSPTISSFFDACDSKEQGLMIADLRSSWEIYSFNEVKEYRKSNVTRMKLMKREFGRQYKIAEATETLPKILIKMGSMHLVRGKNWLGNYDLGNTIKELAYLNGTESTSINCFARYSRDSDGILYDYLDDKQGKALEPILALAEKDTWVLIDTKPIAAFVKKNKIQLNSDLNILIFGFDFVLLAPIKTEVVPNYAE